MGLGLARVRVRVRGRGRGTWLVWYTMYSFISSGDMADSLEAKTWLGLGLGF